MRPQRQASNDPIKSQERAVVLRAIFMWQIIYISFPELEVLFDSPELV